MDLVWDNRRNDYNDEGFYWDFCSYCSSKTEHESGSCCACANRRIRLRVKREVRTVSVGDYAVTIYPNGTKYCDCKGFQFRKDCKHVKSV